MTQGQSQVNLLTIQKFADLCGTTPKALRLYEKKGILKPFKLKSSNNYRFYSVDQARDLMQVKLLQNFGFTLSEIKSLARKQKISDALSKRIELHNKELLEKQKKGEFLTFIKSFLLEDPNNNLITNSEIGPIKLITKKIDNGEYKKIAQYLGELRQVVKELGLKTGTDEFAFYLDKNYKPQHTKIEVALPIEVETPFNIQLPENVEIKEYPTTQTKVFTYRGPFEYLNLVYQKLIQEYKLKSNGPYFDVYKNASEKISKYDLVTEIIFPQDQNS